MVNSNGSFLLYTEHGELISQLSDAQAGALFKAVFEYTTKGIIPKLDSMCNIVFISIRQDLDRNAEKYKEKCKKMKENGKKGGRPSKDTQVENPIDESEKNQKLFFKTKKSLYDNDNENENDNNLSLNKEIVTEKEREILENYVKKNKLARKSVQAYVAKIIANGDYKRILAEQGCIPDRETIIKRELESITDKKSALKVLAEYYNKGSPPAEFNEVMKKYDLDTFEKAEKYYFELTEHCR